MSKNPVVHAIAAFVLFGAPFLIGAHGISDLTIGAILTAVWHWAGNYVNGESAN